MYFSSFFAFERVDPDGDIIGLEWLALRRKGGFYARLMGRMLVDDIAGKVMKLNQPVR